MGAFDLRKAQGSDLYEKILKDSGADAARVAKGTFELGASKAGFWLGRTLKGLSYFGLVRGGVACVVGGWGASRVAAVAAGSSARAPICALSLHLDSPNAPFSPALVLYRLLAS